MLTLVPGVIGGSETYARELVRALERVGEHKRAAALARDTCAHEHDRVYRGLAA